VARGAGARHLLRRPPVRGRFPARPYHRKRWLRRKTMSSPSTPRRRLSTCPWTRRAPRSGRRTRPYPSAMCATTCSSSRAPPPRPRTVVTNAFRFGRHRCRTVSTSNRFSALQDRVDLADRGVADTMEEKKERGNATVQASPYQEAQQLHGDAIEAAGSAAPARLLLEPRGLPCCPGSLGRSARGCSGGAPAAEGHREEGALS
jgi:hypothetical protein